MSPTPLRLAVVGAGVSGLAAALELCRLAARSRRELSLTLLDSQERTGGKLLAEEFADVRVDLGAESLLARGDALGGLLERLGLEQEVVRPATGQAAIWDGRRLRPIPRDSVLGVPTRPLRAEVVSALGAAGAVRASLEPLLPHPRPDADSDLGTLIRTRLGSAVFKRLVDPLVGGVYAGPATQLSLGAVAPALAAAAERGSLLRELRRTLPGVRSESPFLSFRGGLGLLAERMTARLPEGALLVGQRVESLAFPGGAQVRLVPSHPPAAFDGVVLAVPAPAAAAILGSASEALASLLRQLEYASVATVTLSYREGALSRPLRGSGFLTTRRPHRTLTACTFLDRKWPELRRPGRLLLRASAGGLGEEPSLALDDVSLLTAIHRELRPVLGLTEVPRDGRIQRWHGALPQFRAGHLAWRAQVAAGVAQLPAPLELTGAALAGVGVAACLQHGAEAARRVWARLEGGDRPGLLTRPAERG